MDADTLAADDDTLDVVPSVRAQIAALAVGQTYSRSERIALAGRESGHIESAAQRLRNTLKPAVKRVVAAQGGEFQVEQHTWITHSGLHAVATITVTRVA